MVDLPPCPLPPCCPSLMLCSIPPKTSHAHQPDMLCHTTTLGMPHALLYNMQAVHPTCLLQQHMQRTASPPASCPYFNWCTTRYMLLHCSAHRSAHRQMVHLDFHTVKTSAHSRTGMTTSALATHPTVHCPAVTPHRFTSWPAAAAGCVAPVPAW